ncbi:MAG: Crp/Fnr family transcriptional regulator [bacterium]|nr:Crp/Fnr family transcriptional regulator [bacterium]
MNNKITEKLEKFFTQFKHQTYRKGEILIRADDDPSGVFYLKDGFVKEYAISKKGDELIINIFKPIALFPMSWAVNNTPNQYFYEATTDLDLWKAPKEEIIEFIKTNPDVLYNLVSRIYKGVDGILTRMTYLMAGNAYARLIAELIIHVKRFGASTHISEKDLAAQSGMTRETVSREMKILKDKGLVDFSKGTLSIIDLQKLEKELLEDV